MFFNIYTIYAIKYKWNTKDIVSTSDSRGKLLFFALPPNTFLPGVVAHYSSWEETKIKAASLKCCSSWKLELEHLNSADLPGIRNNLWWLGISIDNSDVMHNLMHNLSLDIITGSCAFAVGSKWFKKRKRKKKKIKKGGTGLFPQMVK